MYGGYVYVVMNMGLIFFPHVSRCVSNNIHVLNLPAHTTHLLQVADISIFGPFKRELPASLNLWRTQHEYTIQPQHMVAATRKAWERAAKRANCIAGFEKAGIWPYDRTKITEKVYKEGVLHRGLVDDSVRYTPPPVPLYPPVLLDSGLSSSSLVSARPPLIETTESVLAPPQPIPIKHKKPRAPNTISTTYAVMLEQPQIIEELKRKKAKKEAEEKKQENKRKREEKKQEKAANTITHSYKRQRGYKRLINRHNNKENTPPTSQNIIVDPYE